MYEILFFAKPSGKSPVEDFLKDLDQRAMTDKTARIQLKQIIFHLDLLAESGTRIGTTYAKHLDGQIWELTPGGHGRLVRRHPE